MRSGGEPAPLPGLAWRVYRERMPGTSPEAPVEGPRVDELKGWSSLWGDLLLVEMTLHTRSRRTTQAANLFARRALWEAAVTAYWRTANTGRRQPQITELLAELGDEAEECHKEIEEWRNQHVAHRVDDLRERVDVRLSLDKDGAPKKTVVRVAPVLGPEEEGSDLSRTCDVPSPCAEGPGLGDAYPAARSRNRQKPPPAAPASSLRPREVLPNSPRTSRSRSTPPDRTAAGWH